MARIIPTGPDTFQYIDDEKEQVDIETQPASPYNHRNPENPPRIGAPFLNGMGQPLYTSGGYSAPQSGWQVSKQHDTGPGAFQVTEWYNPSTGEYSTQTPRERGDWGGSVSGGGGAAAAAAPAKKSEPGWTAPASYAATATAPAYRGPYAHGYDPNAPQAGEPEVIQMGHLDPRLEPQVSGYRTDQSGLEPQVQYQSRLEPEVHPSMTVRPQTMLVPGTTPRADPGYSLYGNQQPRVLEPEVTGQRTWDPMLEPQVQQMSAIPAELQAWADEHGIQITQQQIDQYNAIQQGGWR